MRKEQIKQGYQHVTSPHIGSKDLYVTSGHYDKYGESWLRKMKMEMLLKFIVVMTLSLKVDH